MLDTVDGTAQFRLVSNISACDEKLFIDDIEITVSEEVPAEGEKTVIMDEDFDSLWSLDHSQNVIRDDGWNAEHGQAMTSGWNDGMLKFAEVATSDPVELTMDMRAEGLRYFENDNDWGCIADSLRVEVQIDGGDWVLLDEFQVNDAGTAMVGSLTGQTFNGDMTGLSYSGGVLDTASDDVQVRLVSDISSSNEQIYVDNVQIVSVADADDAKEDLLVNGDLESHTPAGHVYVNNQVQGWTNDNGAIETWAPGPRVRRLRPAPLSSNSTATQTTASTTCTKMCRPTMAGSTRSTSTPRSAGRIRTASRSTGTMSWCAPSRRKTRTGKASA